jgi:2-methylcitrate dehydratase PrpD
MSEVVQELSMPTQQLHVVMAEWISTASWDGLSSAVRAAAKDALVDYVGVAVAASREDVANACLQATNAATSNGMCSIIGREERLTAPLAAMVNATLGHAFDYDDVYMPGAAHYSTICIPAALALSEQAGGKGKDFLASLVVGNEAGGRIALATRSERGAVGIRLQGFFPTSAGGTISGAAAAARALEQNVQRTAHTIGLSTNFASGLASIGHGDNNSKCLLAGHAAQAAVQSALYAQAGFTCQANVMESPRGFLNAFAGGFWNRKVLDRAADEPWVVESLSYKRYPVEYVIHPLVELAVSARPFVEAQRSRIASIEVSCYSGYALFDPPSLKHAPPDGYAAVFSAPYCIARALSKEVTGHLTLSDFTDEYVCDTSIQELASKVHFVSDSSFDRDFPARVSARMKITTIDGKVVFEDFIEHPTGSPQRPLSRDQLIEKFHHNCRAWSHARRTQALETLYRVDEAPNSDWISSLR